VSDVALSARDLRLVRQSGGFCLEVDAVDLHRGSVLAILGANGAGKSTLLRCLAGLERVDRGRVTHASRDAVTLVFQRPAALAGSVAHNVRAALYGSGRSREEVTHAVRAALDRFEIGALAERRAATLSGGELRRLALARAFVLEPAVLLLDEPFDDLDTQGQASLSLDLRRVIAETGVAVAMVTHDLRRALLLADRMAVLEGGRIVQQGPRDDLLERPASCSVARIVGMENLLAGRIVRTESGCWVEVAEDQRIPVESDLAAGLSISAGIRPEDLKLDVGRGEGAPIGKGVVTSIVRDGATVALSVDWAGVELRTVVLAGRGLGRTLSKGDGVNLSVRPERVHLVPDGDAG
jgi:ABC-type sulfate/molybdate transport systems ATPase subunit